MNLFSYNVYYTIHEKGVKMGTTMLTVIIEYVIVMNVINLNSTGNHCIQK